MNIRVYLNIISTANSTSEKGKIIPLINSNLTIMKQNFKLYIYIWEHAVPYCILNFQDHPFAEKTRCQKTIVCGAKIHFFDNSTLYSLTIRFSSTLSRTRRLAVSQTYWSLPLNPVNQFIFCCTNCMVQLFPLNHLWLHWYKYVKLQLGSKNRRRP